MLLTAFYAHAEESVILNHGVFIAMSRRSQTNIVGVALKWAIVHQGNLARDVPSCKSVGELERTVLYQFCVKSAISSIVDILKEDTVHRRLYGSP